MDSFDRYDKNERLKLNCRDCQLVIDARHERNLDSIVRFGVPWAISPQRKRDLRRIGAPGYKREPKPKPVRPDWRALQNFANKIRADCKSAVDTWIVSQFGSAKALRRELNRKREKLRYDADPAKARMRANLYKHAHPETKARWHDKRAQRAQLFSDGTVTREGLGQLFARARRCPYCECRLDRGNKSLDHIEPLSRGGAHSIKNVLVCCRPCNLKKRNVAFSDWLGKVKDSRRLPLVRMYQNRFGSPGQAFMPMEFSVAV